MKPSQEVIQYIMHWVDAWATAELHEARSLKECFFRNNIIELCSTCAAKWANNWPFLPFTDHDVQVFRRDMIHLIQLLAFSGIADRVKRVVYHSEMFRHKPLCLHEFVDLESSCAGALRFKLSNQFRKIKQPIGPYYRLVTLEQSHTISSVESPLQS